MQQYAGGENPMLDGLTRVTNQQKDPEHTINNNNFNFVNLNNCNSYPLTTPVIAEEKYVLSANDAQSLTNSHGTVADRCQADVGCAGSHAVANSIQTKDAPVSAAEHVAGLTDKKPEGPNQASHKPLQLIPASAGDRSVANAEYGPGSAFAKHRRPMNAFLMFCKRHRGVVRKRYVGRENRFITRILGDWWKQLGIDKKLPFITLAREYRTMYLLANPGFKWCKQGKARKPAPPTQPPPPMNSVQSTTDRALSMVVKTNVPDMEAAESLVKMAQGVGLPPVATFKLADDEQMGSLSELYEGAFVAGSFGQTYRPPNAVEHNYFASHNDVVALQGPLLTHCRSNEEPCQNMRQHFFSQSHPLTAEVGNQGLSIASPSGGNTPKGDELPSVEQNQEQTRASRTCKGKRYRDFILHQLNNASSRTGRKPARKRPANGTNGKAVGFGSNPADGATAKVHADSDAAWKQSTVQYCEMTDTLYNKIDDLPCMNIDDFQSQKTVEKNRKKPHGAKSKAGRNRRGSSLAPPKSNIPSSQIPVPPEHELPVERPLTAFMSPPAPVPAAAPAPVKLVGCRKRKGLKEKITRNPYP